MQLHPSTVRAWSQDQARRRSVTLDIPEALYRWAAGDGNGFYDSPEDFLRNVIAEVFLTESLELKDESVLPPRDDDISFL